MQAESLWQRSTLPRFTCKPGFDTFRGKAETARHVESCVPINLHFSFPLPGSSVDLKVLMKTICLQKGFLSRACYHKSSTEAVQMSEANPFPAQKIGLGPVMGWGTCSACLVIWSHSTWPRNGPLSGLLLSLMSLDVACPYQPLSSALKAHIPDAARHLPTSCGAYGATEQERGSSPALQMQETQPLRERQRGGRQQHESCTERMRLHGSSHWRVGRWAFASDLELTTAAANGERLRSPSPTHTSILGCLLRIRWGKGLGSVPWSSQAAAHSNEPSQQVWAQDKPDTSEFVVEH